MKKLTKTPQKSKLDRRSKTLPIKEQKKILEESENRGTMYGSGSH